MLQLGIVTYNIAKDWDLPTILTRLEKLEVRRGRAADDARAQGRGRTSPREQRAGGPEAVRGLARRARRAWHARSSTRRPTRPWCRKNIEGTKEYVRLAHDIGAPGVKVRPNGIPKGADLEATLRQIGRALHEVGEDATGFGVEIRVEVHGGVTQQVPNFAKIIAARRPPERLRLLELEPDRRRRRLGQATTSPSSAPRSARSTSATSPTRNTPGASCSPCSTAQDTTATPSPRSPTAPTPSGCSAISAPSGWRISLGEIVSAWIRGRFRLSVAIP